MTTGWCGVWGHRDTNILGWFEESGSSWTPDADQSGYLADNWNPLISNHYILGINTIPSNSNTAQNVSISFNRPYHDSAEDYNICSYWVDKPNFVAPNPVYNDGLGDLGQVAVNPIIINIENGKYTTLNINTAIYTDIVGSIIGYTGYDFDNGSYINIAVNIACGRTPDTINSNPYDRIKYEEAYIDALLRNPSPTAKKNILNSIKSNVKNYNTDIYNLIYDVTESSNQPKLNEETDFVYNQDTVLLSKKNNINQIFTNTQSTALSVQRNINQTSKRWCLRYIQIKAEEYYNWSDYSSVGGGGLAISNFYLYIVVPVLFIQQPYIIKKTSITVGWEMDNDETNVTTGAIDYTGYKKDTNDPPKLVVKNNTDESVIIWDAEHLMYKASIASGTINDSTVPAGTTYDSDSSHIQLSGGTDGYTIPPSTIMELPDNVVDVTIKELSSDDTNPHYYGVIVQAINYADIDNGRIYHNEGTKQFTSLYLLQFGYPANGTVYPSADFTDFAAIPSYETAGKISRNLDIEIRDNSYTSTSKWTLSVYKSYDGNTFESSVDTNVKLTAAGNMGNGQLTITGGNTKVTVTAEFPENVRKGHKDGNIAVWYNFYLKIEGASVDWASNVLLTVKQKEPSILFANPQTQISAGATSANFSMSSSNPWYLQCMDTKNDMAEDWIGQKYEGSNGTNNVEIDTPYSYENKEDYNAQTWTYTVRIYARPVNASKNDTSWITNDVYYKEYTITQSPGIFEIIYDDNGNDAAGLSGFSPYGSEIKYNNNPLVTPPIIHVRSSAPWTYTVQTANPDKPYLQTMNGVTVKSDSKNAANENETTYNLLIPASRNYNNNTAYTLTFGYTKDGNLIDKTNDKKKNKIITVSQDKAIFDINTDQPASGFSSDGGTIIFRVRSSNYWNYGYPSDTNPKLTKTQETLPNGSTTINGTTSILPALTDSLITFSVPENENVDVDRTFKTAFWSRILPPNKTYATVSSSDATANTDLFVVKTINITQGKAAEISGFELYDQNKQNLLQSNAFSNIPRIGGSYVFYIKNVGNVPATFKISITSKENWLKFIGDTNITVAKNDFGDVRFTINENVLTTENRSATISVMQTSPVQDERLITVTQLGGAKGFTLDWYDRYGNQIEGVIKKDGMTLTGIITNTGTVQSKYIVSCETAYSQSMSSDTALTEFVGPGSKKTFKITISPNKTAETRTGLAVTVQDYNDYSMSKTVSWSQDAWPEPSFSLTVRRWKSGNTYGDIMPQGSTITTETPYFILADLPAGHDDKLKWSASADSAYAGDLILNGISSITWPQKLTNGTEFHYNTIQNKTLYDQFITVTVECYYDDADVKSDKYNKSTPFIRTFSYTVKSTLVPTIIISDYGDSYLTPSGTTPIYLFGPAAGTRTFSVTETQGAECIWSVGKPNNVSYASASPATSSAYTTVRVGCTNKMSSNVGLSGSGSISATALCSGNTTTRSINFGIFRFPKPVIQVTGGTSHSFNCNDNPYTFEITTANSFNIGGVTHIYNAEYSFESSNNSFNVERASNGIKVTPPVNTSTTESLVCNITVYYNWGSDVPDHDQDESIIIRCVVEPAPAISFMIDPVDENGGHTWKCDAQPDNPLTVKVYVDAGGNAAMSKLITWTYTRNEYGTDGSEFVIRRGKTDRTDCLTVRPPVNPSTVNYKECHVTFEYGYEGSDEKKTFTAVYSVEPAPQMKITLEPSSVLLKPGEVDPFNIMMNVTDENNANLPLPVSWDYEKVESNNTDDFLIRQFTEQDFQLAITPPKNTSTDRQKKCDITFTCWYADGDGKKTWSATGTYVVAAADNPVWDVNTALSDDNTPTLDITDDASDGRRRVITAAGGGFVLTANLQPGDNARADADTGEPGLETEWDWSKEEKGTDGDEFVVKRSGDRITVDCPSNASVSREKKCVLTFTYGYVGSDTRWSDTYTFIVMPNSDIEFSVDPQNMTLRADGKIMTDSGLDDQKLTVTYKGGADNVPVVWSFVKDERGTDGDEFTVVRTADPNVLRLVAPQNQSVSKSKECTLTFTYGYEGGDSNRTYICKYTVPPAGEVTITVDPPQAVGSADGYGYTDPDNESTALERMFDIAVKVTGDPDTLRTVWSWTKTERGTDGDEFDVRDNGPEGIRMRMPENTTAEKQKECVITFTYGYEDGDRTWKTTCTYTVNAAGILTLKVEPETKIFDALETDGSLGPHITASVTIGRDDVKNDKLQTNWSFEKEEIGTTGDEFRVSKQNDGKELWVYAPTNESRTTVKKCTVYVRAYLGSDDTTNTTTQICDYRVSTLGLPLISFDKISDEVDPSVVTEMQAPVVIDGKEINVTLYTRQTSKQYAAYRWEADKQEIEFNGKIVARIDNTNGVFDSDGESHVLLTVDDTELNDEQIIGMFTFTGYDVNDNMSKKIRLQVVQGGMEDYRPAVSTGVAVTQQNATYMYYNIGIPAYVSADKQSNFDFGEIKDKDGSVANYNIISRSKGQCDITDWGIMIRKKGNNKWIEIWQSKYKDKDFKPILTNTKDPDMYTACLAYTNNMIKFKIDSEYEYKAVIKADYRHGAADKSEWVKGEVISGEVKSFVYQAFRIEKDPETIRPYFLPKESIAGYLGGCEVKNFFNSKAVAFNRKKNPVITVSNFATHWTEDDGVKINITDALVDSILHTPAFNAAWAYINDPDNITHAKTEYIKNVILPNIIVNADSAVEIWADTSTDGLSVSDGAGEGWARKTNIGTKFETESDGSKTLTFDITEQHPYCFIMKLKY